MAVSTEESIHAAVRSGDIKKIYEILERNPFCVNDFDENQNSPLHLIYDYPTFYKPRQVDYRLQIMELLIKYGADVNIQDKYHMTPLYHAIENRKITGVWLLLKKKADPNTRNFCNDTALMTAVSKGNFNDKSNKIIELLLKNGADPNLTDSDGKTALDHAIQLNRFDYVRTLITNGARVKNVFRTFSRRWSLVDFDENSDEDYSIPNDFLISYLKQTIESSEFSISVLDDGYSHEHVLIFLELLRLQKVNVNVSASVDLILHKAVLEGDLRLVKKILLEKKKPSVNAKNLCGETPLHLMTKMNNRHSFYSIARLLLDAGADLRELNLIDETPFYLAVNNKEYTLIQMMLNRIAKVNNVTFECNFINLPALKIRYTENDVALHELLVAISVDCEPVIDRLLEEDYNIDEASKRCRQDVTIALVKAIEMGNCNIVKKLLEFGFRTNRCFPGDLFDLQFSKGDKIGILCLLREYDERSSLIELFYNTVRDFFSQPKRNVLIYLIRFYYVIDNYEKSSDSDLARLRSSKEWKTILTAKFAECKDDVWNIKMMKFADVSAFDVMTMKLDSFVKLLKKKKWRDACKKQLVMLKKKNELKYYYYALEFRLELALKKSGFVV